MNRRIEAYIILGAYFAIGLFLGYSIGKHPEPDNKTHMVKTAEKMNFRYRK